MTTSRPLHPRSLPGDNNLDFDEPPPPYSASPPSSTVADNNNLPPTPTYTPAIPATTTNVTTRESPPPQRGQLLYTAHPLIPPPSYSRRDPPPQLSTRRTRGAHSQTAAAAVGFLSAYEEKSRLAKLLSKHRWRTYYGPKPRTLTAALRKAALWGDRPFVSSILGMGGAEIWGRDQNHPNTCVHEALRGPKPDIALDILNWYREENKGAGIQWILDAKDKETGCTPLHVAAESGNVGVVMALVEMGAKVDAVDDLERTPLLMGARYRRLEVVDGLLDCGADAALVRRELWDKWREGSKEREALGGWEVVRGVLRGAIQRRRGLELGEEEEEEEEEEELPEVREDRGLEVEESIVSREESPQPPPRVDSEGGASFGGGGGGEPSGSRVPEMTFAHDALFRSITDIMDGSRTRHERGINWQFIQAAMLSSNLGEQDPLVRRMLHVQGALNNPSMQPSFVNSPEYEAWRADCEVLLAEHRRQRERNQLAEARGLERFGARR
ncbi:hypothetical protein QBC44DRAFT_378782 [Cladorrhinum sp. PSN332]|nr:hypothetical protein QBC44DRAFT_378782 [Cladorrhinum sp. PSN332]